MGIGLLFINNGHQDMYLPIFHEDREYAFSVLTYAMKECMGGEVKPYCHPSSELFKIANELGSKATNASHLWIGPEAASDQCLGGVEDACQNALYIFAADFEDWKIVVVK